MEEGEGFEPSAPFRAAVFKTAALDQTMRSLLAAKLRIKNARIKIVPNFCYVRGNLGLDS